jgi:hypothetical protein
MFIVMDLLYLIMIGNKKQGVEFENKLGPFQLYDASRSTLTIPSKTRCPCFPNLRNERC